MLKYQAVSKRETQARGGGGGGGGAARLGVWIAEKRAERRRIRIHSLYREKQQ